MARPTGGRDIGDSPSSKEKSMNRKSINAARCLVAALALGTAGLAAAQDSWRPGDPEYVWRFGRGAEWNPAAAEGHCRLKIYVDDKATVALRGDQITVHTCAGKRSYDQGSACNQPLPFHAVSDFRVTSERGRGHIVDVRAPHRDNDFTGSIAINDPAPAGELYVIDVAWSNPRELPARPLPSADPYPWFDETRPSQDRIRPDFLSRNNEDADLEFTCL